MTKQRIGSVVYNSKNQAMPYSKALKYNDTIYMCGQIGVTENGQLVEGGIEAQTRQAMENIRSILAEAGATLDDIVKTTVWITDASLFAAFNEVYSEFFGETPPARSTVVSDLILQGALVEIEPITILNAGS